MALTQFITQLTLRTERQGLLDITERITAWTAAQPVSTGLLTVLCRHTSASLHADEGPDDMPAHLRTALTQVQLSIPLIGGKPALGTWQAIYLFEHRRRPHSRTLVLHLMG